MTTQRWSDRRAFNPIKHQGVPLFRRGGVARDNDPATIGQAQDVPQQ